VAFESDYSCSLACKECHHTEPLYKEMKPLCMFDTKKITLKESVRDCRVLIFHYRIDLMSKKKDIKYVTFTTRL